MNETNVIYIIGAKESPLVKIGTSDNVRRRLREIQNMCPVKLHVLWQTPGCEQIERALHRRFKAWRKHGEWFDLRDPVTDVQQALQDPSLLIRPQRRTPFKSARPAVARTPARVVLKSSWSPPIRLRGEAARVHQALCARISAGEFSAGGELPRPAALAKEYGVATITASSAVKCLEAQGLVTWPHGQAAVVR